MTKLYNSIIYGPVKSRRLGISLGINLLPVISKACSFNCIYCECGQNEDYAVKGKFASEEDFNLNLSHTLQEMKRNGQGLDTITFAGNGEPTLHPAFAKIIDTTISLRNQFYPACKISVLSNATTLGRSSVREALGKVDNAILKIDSAFERTIRLMDRPQETYSLDEVVENMCSLPGRFYIQTMFLRGYCNKEKIDNTTSEEVKAWQELILRIRPFGVMVYSIDRDTPCKTLEKISKEEMSTFVDRLLKEGINCSIA